MSRSRRRPLLPALLGALALGCGDPRPPPVNAGAASNPSSAGAGLDSLMVVADSLYAAGEYVQARAAWSDGLDQLQTGRNLAAEGRILTSLGLTEWRLGDYERARARTEQARVLLEAAGLRDSLPRTYNALGLIAGDQGRLAEAAELWRQTMTIAREVGDQEYVAKPAMNLGLWYAGIGDLEQAWSAFAASLVAGRTLGIRALELRSLVNLAMVANQMGEPRLALAWLDSAVVAGVDEDFLAEDNYRSQLALAAWGLGDPGVALAGLDSAVRQARESGFRQSEAANITLMADIYWEAGDLRRALGLHAQAEAIHGELELPTEQGQNLQSAARIRAAMGHTPQALDLASRALRLHLQAEDLPHQLEDRLLLAELGAPGHLTEARRIARKLSTRPARTRLGLAEARLEADAGRPRDVLQALASIGPDLANGMSAEVGEAEALRARAYTILGQWDSAAASGQRAIEALERIRGGHGSSLLRASFASYRAGTYGNLVAALLALGRTDDAFDVADAARGGWVELPRPARRGADAPTAGPAREGLLRRIAVLEDEIRFREEDELDTAELQERLGRAEREYEIAILSAGGGASGVLRPDGRAGQIRETLRPDEMMLAYLVTPERLVVFTMTREGAVAREVPVRSADVEARVRLARQLLGDAATSPAEAEAVLAILGRWLLGTTLDGASGVKRLIIVPHGVLAYLPFGALRTAGGPYLVERYSLVHLPSASFAAGAERHPPSPDRAALRLTALAPLPRALPATALEVDAVARAHRGARVLVGGRASEPALRDALRSGAVAHVASHGVLNGMNPLFSRIELVPGRNRVPADDGRLEVHEVLGLEIRSPLVFLSGCETGLGPGASRRYAPGEDYATLAAAFLAAGAGQVVSTLWAIPDSGAAVFTAGFYARLGQVGPAEALAGAQRALLATARFRHPYYWAGYRLAGSESIGWPAAVP
jgi:CHAT domain-containing protein/tetratricopeptide (TPR) repeat protein